MIRTAPRLVLPLLLAITATAAASAPPKQRIYRNPSNSVHIRSETCGSSLCGTVVWANDKAKADSARGGTPNLIGLQLFRDFKPDGPDKWKGSVFVPDINKTFSGHITRVNATTLKGSGCLVGKMGCKSQEWTLIK
nr:DUF2147 domain-containing protein [Polymorphobacter sp.]